VKFPPGRDRDWMKPEPMGSETLTNTIGIVRLSRCSAAATGVVCARITSGCATTISFASDSNFSAAAKRTSIWTLRPSAHPRFSSLCRNAARRAFISASSSAEAANTLTRRKRSACCARAVNGPVAATPARSDINSRRLICRSEPQDRHHINLRQLPLRASRSASYQPTAAV